MTDFARYLPLREDKGLAFARFDGRRQTEIKRRSTVEENKFCAGRKWEERVYLYFSSSRVSYNSKKIVQWKLLINVLHGQQNHGNLYGGNLPMVGRLAESNTY